MRIIEAINRIDSLKHNTYTQPEKIAWLSTLDAMAKAHVIDTHEGSENVTFSGYDQNTDLNTVLLIPAPYEEAYIKWLEAQIDYANGEYGKYNNTIESFNTFWNAYKNFYNRTHRPLRNHVRYFGGGRNPGNGGGQAAPPALAPLQKQIGDLKNLKTDTKENLVAAINEVLLKGADPEEIQKIVEEYLEAHPGEAKIGMTAESDPTVFDWAKKELFNKANLIDPAGRNTFITIDGVEYYRYHCSAQNFEYVNPHPLPGSVTITIRTVSQYTDGVSGIVLHYADGTSDVIYPERGVVTAYTTDASKTFVKMSGRYDMENWNLIDMSVMSIQANYNIGIPVANANAHGGVKAEPVTENDTQPVRIGEDGMLYTAPGGIPGAGNARETTVLAEFTLTEDVDGTIRIPLSANPFAYSALLIEIRSQLMTGGRTQYMGQLYGGGKHSLIFHLNTVFDASSVRTVYVMTHLFHDAVHSIAAKKGDYMWNTTNHYTDVYPIETQADAKECVLEIENCSAVSGATFKVQGVK